jgi:hypothetical protein
MWETRSLALSQASLAVLVGLYPFRRTCETRKDSNTRWRRSPEKLSQSEELRIAFRDASGRSESASSRDAGEFVGVVDVEVEKVERREQESLEQRVNGEKWRVGQGRPPRMGTYQPHTVRCLSTTLQHTSIFRTSLPSQHQRIWARFDPQTASVQVAQ